MKLGFIFPTLNLCQFESQLWDFVLSVMLTLKIWDVGVLKIHMPLVKPTHWSQVLWGNCNKTKISKQYPNCLCSRVTGWWTPRWIFPHEGATARTTEHNLNFLRQFFDDRVISLHSHHRRTKRQNYRRMCSYYSCYTTKCVW